MDPFAKSILNKDGTPRCKKVYVIYVDGDEKLCDGCDKKKEGVASIMMICDHAACLCQDCILDILSVWNEPRELRVEKIIDNNNEE